MDRLELAWAAGFFDGDGWAGVVRSRDDWRPMARINQASSSGTPEVLERFAAAVLVGSLGGPYPQPGRRPIYAWTASSIADVGHVRDLIYPWLGPIKRRQFDATIGAPWDLGDLEQLGPKGLAAWSAGFFDAEGCVSLSPHRTHNGYFILEAAVTQAGVDGVPVELSRFASGVSCGRVFGPYAQRDAVKPVYRWRAHRSEDVGHAIDEIRPWLSTPKRLQADRALAIVLAQPQLPRGKPAWGAYKTHCVNGHEYASARVRPFVSRRGGNERRASKQCLTCLRERARAARIYKLQGC